MICHMQTMAPGQEVGVVTASDSERDALKRERALRKKLKQIRELQAKIASGEISKPDQNQLDKIAKQDEVEEELEKLTGGK